MRCLLALLVIPLLGLAGCDAPGAASAPGNEIEVRLGDVLVDPDTQSPVVVLREKRGARQLPIWIGAHEALSITAARDRQRPPRPNTHDLAKRLVDRLDAAVERIVVTKLSQGIYYALIHLRAVEGPLSVDARPSDAIAIALRYQAPLFVEESLLVESANLEPGAPSLPEGHPRIGPGEDPHRSI